MLKALIVLVGSVLVTTMTALADTGKVTGYYCNYYDKAISPHEHPIAIALGEKKTVLVNNGKYTLNFDTATWPILGLTIIVSPAGSTDIISSFSLIQGSASVVTGEADVQTVCFSQEASKSSF